MNNADSEEILILNKWAHSNCSINIVRTNAVLFLAQKLFNKNSQKMERMYFSKLLLLIFAIDDIFDSSKFSMNDFDILYLIFSENNIDHIKSIQCTEMTNTIKNLFFLFNHLYNETGFDTNKNIEKYFWRIIQDTWSGMVIEAKKKELDGLTIELYLKNARYSVGIPMAVIFTLFKIYSQSFNEDILEELLVNIEIGGEIARLANDIRSYKKELSEKKINSLTILLEQGKNFNQATDEISLKISEKVKLLEFYYQKRTKLPKKFKEFSLSFCKHVITFYTVTDFHTFNAEVNIQDILR